MADTILGWYYSLMYYISLTFESGSWKFWKKTDLGAILTFFVVKKVKSKSNVRIEDVLMRVKLGP